MGRIIREEGEIFYGINFCFVRARRWSNRTGRERREGGGGRKGLGDWVLTAKLRILERERGGGGFSERDSYRESLCLAPCSW